MFRDYFFNLLTLYKKISSKKTFLSVVYFMAHLTIQSLGVSTVPSAFTQIPTKKVSSMSRQSRSTPTVILLQPLNFTRTLRDDIVYAGDNPYILKCDIKGIKRPVKVLWTFNGKPLNKSKNILIKTRKNKFRLRIRHLTKKHSGVYGCHVSDDLERVIKSYGTLQVIEARTGMQREPEITSVPLNITAVQRSRVKLRCTAVGSPDPTIRWKIDGKYAKKGFRQENDTSYLTFLLMKNISVSCEASNSQGKETRTAFVIASGTNKPRITRPPNNRTVDMGDEVTLLCRATGFPRPVIRWEVDGKYYIEVSPDENGTITYTFKVKKQVTVACKAQNKLGVDSRIAMIDLKQSATTQAKRVGPLEQNHLIMLTAGAGVLCVVIIVAYVLMKRRHKAKFNMQRDVKSNELLKNPIYDDQSSSCKTSTNSRLERLEIPRNSIEFVKNLEDGLITNTFLGTINHPTGVQKEDLVMVKVLKETNPSSIIRETFDDEAYCVSMYNHINVQSLVGVCANSVPLCMVFEFSSDYQNLNDFLRDCDSPSHYVLRQRSDTNRSLDNELKLSGLDLLCMARQIASGMEYLSDVGHIHKQLCTMNCIVGKALNVKISGIGISWSHPCTNYYTLDAKDRERYPVRWYPPETIQYGAFSEDTDIWSFGVVLWELHSFGLEPYYGMNNEEVISLVREGDVLPCPKDCPLDVYQLMKDCWNLLPNDRPRFSSLHERISALYLPTAV